MPNNVDITFTAVGTAKRIREFIQQARGTRKPTGDLPEWGPGRPNYNYHPEWTGKAYHIRRRLTYDEQKLVGDVKDIRGTVEAEKRRERVQCFLPAQLKNWIE